MASNLANLKWWLLLAGAAVATVLPAPAQAPMRQGQPILFSTPDNDEVTTNVPSFSAEPPILSGFAGAVQAPTLNFNAAPRTAPLPAPSAPVVATARAAQLQRQLDERKNWTMLTPEEILGLPTPEKMLGLQERDAAGQPKNQTVAERYYERQERQLNSGTNGYAADNSPAQWNFSGSQPPQFTPANNVPGNATLMNRFLNGKPDNNNATASQNPDFNWPKLFSPTATPTAPTPEQQAAAAESAAEFQKLLEPRSATPAAAKTSPGGTIFSASQKPSGPVLGQPAMNPIGLSFAPLSSGISTPAGVTPLPGLPDQNVKPAAPAAPEWKPQLPPWMLSGPQLGVIPQRKF